MQIGGEYDKTKSGFKNLAVVMAVSTFAIFLALVFQFKNAIKPLLVLAAAPYGMVGAFAALWIMGEPFGFMAFLGVASLVGVIVSHSIVLFDFIEERHAVGDDFENAVIDSGILRRRAGGYRDHQVTGALHVRHLRHGSQNSQVGDCSNVYDFRLRLIGAIQDL